MSDATIRADARERLRLFLRDFPALNRLIREYEHTDADLDLALDMTVEEYNTITPPLAYVTIGTYPNLWLLLHGGAIHALKSAGMLQARNELNYSSGGITVRTFDKTSLYQSWINSFIQDYQFKLQNLKLANNITGGFGGVHSPYYNLGWWSRLS
jgi:hypothetical protein